MNYSLGLIGYPIQHSLSPWIHERFFKKTSTAGTYRLIEISSNVSFTEEMTRLKAEGLNGFNVTVPYKEKIIPFLDKMDENAKVMGAVNTVVNENGQWIGYNTDGTGYVRSLQSKYPKLLKEKKTRLLLIGAGGAARGIYYSLIKAGFQNVDIANRTIKSAENIKNLKEGTIHTNILSLDEAQQQLHLYDVIIQTTSVGMKPNQHMSIIQLTNLKTDCIASDIVYQPLQTEFLKQGEAQRAHLHYGHTMLLYQAQAAFEIWTGIKPSTDGMDLELMNKLRGNE
ncbi:shikimate dehydrogenase [Virgibacillus sp. W0430]|uniref:shikimate dehydrogenase n=1 Tax=Virgibacillus sp. W0430 TaxID=3391580 RepID=UPI003F48119A